MGLNHHDLHVDAHSHSLGGRNLDLIVTGSIGAVESVRLIRALRRLGAIISPFLSDGGSQFITETALSWAAAHPCRSSYDGSASHIGIGDGCIVAPASASFLEKLARAQTEDFVVALAVSYLGQNKPLLLLPSMHDSLMAGAQIPHNVLDPLQKKYPTLKILRSRQEEGKHKMPDPPLLADLISHELTAPLRPAEPLLITMGPTRSYLDLVRYIANESSGELGAKLSEELYRHGFKTHVVAGPGTYFPRASSKLIKVRTYEEMKSQLQDATGKNWSGFIYAAAVLDYIWEKPQNTIKLRSDKPSLDVRLLPTEKLIAYGASLAIPRVGFKLEAEWDESTFDRLASEYQKKYNLNAVVMNSLDRIAESRHNAIIYQFPKDGPPHKSLAVTKEEIARILTLLFLLQRWT